MTSSQVGWPRVDEFGDWCPEPARGRRVLPALVTLAGVAVLLAALVAGAVALAPTRVVGGVPLAERAPLRVAAEEPTGTPAPSTTTTTAAPTTTTTTEAPPAAPVQAPHTAGQRPGTVRLPQGGTATLVREEVGPDGVLPIPNQLDEATWWGAGLDAPAGATVMAGHVNWRGATGPFAELWHAAVGQDVTVVDQSGREYRYRITQVVTLRKDELPSRAGELFAQSGPHRLVLATCGGQWVGGEIGYADNQVVIASPVG